MAYNYSRFNFETKNETAEIAGVYMILNKVTQESYVGSTIRGSKRKSEHWSDLRGNRHTNWKLQAGWDKHGESNFDFLVLEYLYGFSEYACRVVEQRYLDELNPIYNISRDAFYGYSDIEVAKRKVDAASREFIVYFPNGRAEKIKNLNDFCRHNNLSMASMRGVIRGKISNHKGFRAKRINDDGFQFKFPIPKKSFIVQFPDGHEETATGLREFCRNNKISVSGAYACLNGEIGHTNKFKFRNIEDKEFKFRPCDGSGWERQAKKVAKSYFVVYPDGKEEVIHNLTQWAKQQGLKTSTLHHVISGDCGHCKGYKIRHLEDANFRFVPMKYKITKNGISFETENLTEFCRQNNMCCSYVRKKCLNDKREHNGYFIEKVKNE